MSYLPNIYNSFDRIIVGLTLAFVILFLGTPIVWMINFGLTLSQAVAIMLGTASTWAIGTALIFFVFTRLK